MLSDYVVNAIVREHRAELRREAEKQRLLRQLPQQPSQRKLRFLAVLRTAQTQLSGLLIRRPHTQPVVVPDVLCCEPAM